MVGFPGKSKMTKGAPAPHPKVPHMGHAEGGRVTPNKTRKVGKFYGKGSRVGSQSGTISGRAKTAPKVK